MTNTTLALNPNDLGRFVQTETYRMHFYEAGAGHPIILLHGSGPGATGWSNFWPNIEHLSATNRVIAVDMPGWGKSDTENDEFGYTHTESLIRFMDELNIEKAALVGNSMGGMTSLITAVKHSDRVSHLITMGAPAPGVNYFGPSDGPSEGLKILFHAYREPTAENMKRLVQIMCFDEEMATDELAQLRSEAALANPAHLESFLNRSFDPSFNTIFPQLSNLEVPSLFIHGRDDRVVGFENSLRLVSLVPNSRMLVLNRCGHWAQIEYPDEFNRTVASFVASN
ncbi:alpha/beta fold hydrolase [Rhodococcus pyridinivorans]|uniref:alpha/beta fold hydrolase n=1 Tax=Rhodococcus pyridinivorans TaxID=103816 RepID=UPI001E4731D2|nr:alpha/beta hydrolase [Rhodococcus pyridinivorans]MCD5422695.1 alpha/beta fold hydrolase [Rhodococcus pyridinivorans]